MLHERMPITPPPLLTDWPTYAQSLDWLERMRDLLESADVWTVELEAALGDLGGAVLLAAAGQTPPDPAGLVDEPPVNGDTETNGHATRATRHTRQVRKGWSIAERLQALGYTAPLTKSESVKLGQQVVQAYREHHGTAPPMVPVGRGPSAQRLARYMDDDLALVDGVLRAQLGEPPPADEPRPAQETDDASPKDPPTG